MRVVDWVGDEKDDRSDKPQRWAAHTRRVLTRDLLRRAGSAGPAESHALQFRALHLNLPLVGDVADRLGLSEHQRGLVEHHALNGLAEAIRTFEAFGDNEFDDYATLLIERQILTHLPRPALSVARQGFVGQRPAAAGRYPVRRLAHRVALVIAGSRV
jgi:hypothetical protein